MFEEISSFILDLELGPSGGLIVVVAGDEVEIGSPESMFISTSDVL